MLPEMETGYEPKFDFAAATPIQTFYLLATVPRTGSTWLSHVLWETGCLGAPLEYLNFEVGGPSGHAHASPDGQQQIWEEALAARTSPNGVFGLKIFPVQLQALQEGNPRLLAAIITALMRQPGSRRIVYLARRDRSAHAASFARAALSGVWREEQEASLTHRPDYSQGALASVDSGIDQMAAVWERTFRQLGIEPLRIWYEDALADPEAAQAQVAAYLGVALDSAARIAVPPVHKQSAPEIADWAARYAETKSRSET
jgi:LPS sulfotransferase NodH